MEVSNRPKCTLDYSWTHISSISYQSITDRERHSCNINTNTPATHKISVTFDSPAKLPSCWPIHRLLHYFIQRQLTMAYLAESKGSYPEVGKLFSRDKFHSQVIECLRSRLWPILFTLALTNTHTHIATTSWYIRDHVWRRRWKPGCRIVGSVTTEPRAI